MSDADREHWNARYRAGDLGGGTPDPWVLAALEQLERECAPGAALDLACGAGRHAVELARRGWQTSGWDASEVGLELCAERARAAGVRVATRQIDFDAPGAFEVPRAFELIVVVDFLLGAARVAQLERLLQPGGWLLCATFAPDWPGERPSARFRIGADALLAQLSGFEPLRVQRSGGRSGVLARRAQRSRSSQQPAGSASAPKIT